MSVKSSPLRTLTWCLAVARWCRKLPGATPRSSLPAGLSPLVVASCCLTWRSSSEHTSFSFCLAFMTYIRALSVHMYAATKIYVL